LFIRQFILRMFMFLSILLMLITGSAFAQGSVTVKGTIFDATNDVGLPGANIEIKGTGIGAATDLDGVFIIHNVPSGKHTLVVTYLGYQTQTIELDLPNSGTVVHHFKLQPTAVEGEEVVVTAQAQGQLQAINQQLASDKIANMVSEARIQELPDFNAAQAISRLPGVSTLESSGEANKVVIRGLAPQFNTVSVEGINLASTGSTQMGVSALGNVPGPGSISNDRSVDLTMVSPYMIKSISVYKSLTPDMMANSIGGTVNMELREAPSELHYNLFWQSGYTAKTKSYGNYRAVGSVSRRFFQDKLGIYLLGNIDKYDRDDDEMSAEYRTTLSTVDPATGYRPVQVRRVPLIRHIETRQRYGGNLILDYKLPSGSIKSVNMYTRLKSDFQDNRTVLNYFDKLLMFTYQQGVNTIDQYINSLHLKYDFKRVLVDMTIAHTYAKNNLPESPFIEFKTGQATTGPVTNNTIPDSLQKLWLYPGDDGLWLDNLNLFSSLYKESNTTFYSDFKFPMRLGSFISGYLKIGGRYYHQTNSNDQSTPYAAMNRGSTTGFQTQMVNAVSDIFNVPIDPAYGKFAGENFTGSSDLTESFLEDQFGQIYWACDPTILIEMARYLDNSPQWAGRATGGADLTGGWYNGIYQNLANSYDYLEDYYAGYLMSEINVKNFMVVGGARYENTQSKYTAYNMYDMRNPESQTYDIAVTHPKNEFWLPMVQTKYSPINWFDIRYAYYQSLARPDYHQLSPKLTYDNPRKQIRSGNPDLTPAEAYNHDLNLTFHSNKLGLFSVGAFYKTINDFTYSTTYILHQTSNSDKIKTIYDFRIGSTRPEDGATLYTFINSPYPAYVKGLEFDFQTRFWYLPYGMDGVVLGINYTKIKSDATYPLRDEVTDYSVRPAVTTTYDSTRTGRLIYQPDDILNSYVGYDYRGFSARVSFVFQGNSVSYIGRFPEQDGYTRDYFRVDFSARQTLPFQGMEIYLDVVNINNEKNSAAQRSIDGFTSVKHYGAVLNIGLRYRL
jgi:TonB-dependent receptor